MMMMIHEPVSGEVATLVKETEEYQLYRFPSGRTLMVYRFDTDT